MTIGVSVAIKIKKHKNTALIICVPKKLQIFTNTTTTNRDNNTKRPRKDYYDCTHVRYFLDPSPWNQTNNSLDRT